ncbi:MAG: SpoIIE family protein phosphatase [Fusobacteriaceae bacterium]|nr:SpoIIE family protein phosphatase [Fusobacteriaceae bacterium]MBN2838149.1 SpoIIE family protein phosphatase [Fusobacteriaceae bacterium]
MDYYIDYSFNSINKFGEELCGDNVEVIKTDDGLILVLADGLGSGVKANILATLTSKIAVTMLKEGLSIEETLDTIMHTLPVCQKRQLAYSTFTIIDVKETGDVYMIEYENPSSFYYRLGKTFNIIKQEKEINGKKIRESNFKMRMGDFLVAVSDGVIHAGVGELLNLGWQWENVNDFLEDYVRLNKSASDVSESLVDVCKNLYNGRAGDDTTVCTITFKEKVYTDLFIGPPKSSKDDSKFLDNFKKSKGYRILSGGTTANIIAREIKEEIIVDLENYVNDLPPMAKLKGVDLVTEGLLTLNRVVDMLKKNTEIKNCPASKIIEIFRKSTNIKIYLGKAINVAHQNPFLPEEFNLKAKVIYELKILLEKLGKIVEIEEV